MANLNQVNLIGRLTRDVELMHTQSGTAIANISLAINEKYKTTSGEAKDRTTFLEVEAFGSIAELCSKYLSKGSSVFFSGRLEMDSWEDKTTGKKRYKLKVVAGGVQFLDRKHDASERGPSHERSSAPERRRTVADRDHDDDVPF